MKNTHTTKSHDFLGNKVTAEIGTTKHLAKEVADAATSGNIKLLEEIVKNLSPDHRAVYEKHSGEVPKAEAFADEQTLYNATFLATLTALGATIGELVDQQKADGARVIQLKVENGGGVR